MQQTEMEQEIALQFLIKNYNKRKLQQTETATQFMKTFAQICKETKRQSHYQSMKTKLKTHLSDEQL